MSDQTKAVLARVDREKADYLEELKDYLRIPSVSADPVHQQDVQGCADFVEEKLRRAGLETEQIARGGNPLVYAEWLGAPGMPTVLFYGHYDVQPPDPLEEWRQ